MYKKKKAAKKSVSAPKSKEAQQREMREKNFAAAHKGDKKTKPPKPAKEKPAKDSKKAGKKAGGKDSSDKSSKPESVALVRTIDPHELKMLQRDADEAAAQLEKDLPEYMAKGANIYATLADVRDRELWKFTSIPFKSWTAFVEHFAKIVDLSTRTLFGVIGATKALPGLSAETKKKIGPRKLQKLAKAVKTVKAQKNDPAAELPPAIIEKAETQSVEEFDETLKREGLIEEREEQAPVPQGSMFSEVETIHVHRVEHPEDEPVDSPRFAQKPEPVYERVANDTSSVAVGTLTGNESVDRAIAVAQRVYDQAMTLDKSLEFVCKEWLKATCDLDGMDDMTNDQAAAHLEIQSKSSGNGKKKRK